MMKFYEANKGEKKKKKKTYKRSTVTKNKQNGSKKKNQISFKCYNMKHLILKE